MAKRAASKCPSAPATGSGAAIGGNIRVPVKLRDSAPRYPDRLNGVEGDAVVTATIGTDGSVQQVDVVSATHQEFADSLVEAVREWRFDVTLLNCVAVETAMKVTGTFRWSK
jgi:TonB family protein